MGAEAEALCGAGYASIRRSAPTPATATGIAKPTPAQGVAVGEDADHVGGTVALTR